MRIIVFFDLPMETSKEIRNYNRFRKFLVRDGFIMVQKSIYAKLTLNAVAAQTVISNIKKNAPPDGLVQMMVITEKQFAKIEFIVGQSESEILNTTDRLVVL